LKDSTAVAREGVTADDWSSWGGQRRGGGRDLGQSRSLPPFGFAEVRMLHPRELYAGKLVAALDW